MQLVKNSKSWKILLITFAPRVFFLPLIPACRALHTKRIKTTYVGGFRLGFFFQAAPGAVNSARFVCSTHFWAFRVRTHWDNANRSNLTFVKIKRTLSQTENSYFWYFTHLKTPLNQLCCNINVCFTSCDGPARDFSAARTFSFRA